MDVSIFAMIQKTELRREGIRSSVFEYGLVCTSWIDWILLPDVRGLETAEERFGADIVARIGVAGVELVNPERPGWLERIG